MASATFSRCARPPPGGWSQTEGGFEFASELVTHIRGRGDFGVAVAGFPEGHMTAAKFARSTATPRPESWLRSGHGYHPDVFRQRRLFSTGRFSARCRYGGTTVADHHWPAPGRSKNSVPCAGKLPEAFAARLDELGDDAEVIRQYGIEYATAQCRELLDRGAPACIFTPSIRARRCCRFLATSASPDGRSGRESGAWFFLGAWPRAWPIAKDTGVAGWLGCHVSTRSRRLSGSPVRPHFMLYVPAGEAPSPFVASGSFS